MSSDGQCTKWRRNIAENFNRLICKEYGMDVNVKKTKVMVFSKEENVKCNIKVNGEYLEQVASYRYLGSIVTEAVSYTHLTLPTNREV